MVDATECTISSVPCDIAESIRVFFTGGIGANQDANLLPLADAMPLLETCVIDSLLPSSQQKGSSC